MHSSPDSVAEYCQISTRQDDAGVKTVVRAGGAVPVLVAEVADIDMYR